MTYRIRLLAAGLTATVSAITVVAAPSATATASPAPSLPSATQDAITQQVEAFFKAVDEHSIAPGTAPDEATLHPTANGAAKFASFVANVEQARDGMAANGVTNEHVTTEVVPVSYVTLGDVVRVQAAVTTTWTDDDPQAGIPADSVATDDWLVDVRDVGGQKFLDDVIAVGDPSETVDSAADILDASTDGLVPSDDVEPPTISVVDKVSGIGTNLGVDHPAAAAATASGYEGPLSGLDYAAMASYARYWSGRDASGNPRYNSNYKRYGNDCTNFVSQALRAGGWPYASSSVSNYKSKDVWDYDVSYYWDSTYTWRVASWLGPFTKHRSWHLDNIWNAGLGDVLQTDWDPNGQADGKIDHSMIVSGRDSNGPRISQHTNHRHNISLQTSMAIARNQGHTKIVWYGYRT